MRGPATLQVAVTAHGARGVPTGAHRGDEQRRGVVTVSCATGERVACGRRTTAAARVQHRVDRLGERERFADRRVATRVGSSERAHGRRFAVEEGRRLTVGWGRWIDGVERRVHDEDSAAHLLPRRAPRDQRRGEGVPWVQAITRPGRRRCARVCLDAATCTLRRRLLKSPRPEQGRRGAQRARDGQPVGVERDDRAPLGDETCAQGLRAGEIEQVYLERQRLGLHVAERLQRGERRGQRPAPRVLSVVHAQPPAPAAVEDHRALAALTGPLVTRGEDKPAAVEVENRTGALPRARDQGGAPLDPHAEAPVADALLHGGDVLIAEQKVERLLVPGRFERARTGHEPQEERGHDDDRESLDGGSHQPPRPRRTGKRPITRMPPRSTRETRQ